MSFILHRTQHQPACLCPVKSDFRGEEVSGMESQDYKLSDIIEISIVVFIYFD